VFDGDAKEVLHDALAAACEENEGIVLGEPVESTNVVVVFGELSQLVSEVQHDA
jgi:hypothetical protein